MAPSTKQHAVPVRRRSLLTRAVSPIAGMRAAVLLVSSMLIAQPSAWAIDCNFERETRGLVQAINDAEGTLMVHGAMYGTDEETEYLDDDNNPVDFAFFDVGSPVEVEFCQPAPGVLPIATKIKIDDNGGPGCETHYRGFIESINGEAKSMVVNGRVVVTTNTTQFLDNNNHPIPFSAFTVDSFVETEGCSNEAGELVATKIKLEDPDDGNNFVVEFRGFVQSTDPAAQTLMVAGRRVVTNDQTQYLDHENAAITFEGIAVNSFVEVEGAVLQDGAVLARKIKLEDNHDPAGEAHIVGFVTENPGDGTLVINNRVVHTTETTEYLDRLNQPITLADFVPGTFAEAEGSFTPAGGFVATKVKMEDHVGMEQEFHGVINSIEGEVFIVNGIPCLTTEETLFLDAANNTITSAEFAAGDHVEVEGNRLPGALFIAEKIKKDDGNDHSNCVPEVEFTGAVESLNPASHSLVVDGKTVNITEDTRIKGPNGHPLPASALQVGMNVKVEGIEGEPGVFDACEIKVRNPNDNGGGQHHVFGLVDSVDAAGGSLVVHGITVVTNEETEIFTRRHDPIALADVLPGMRVHVHGQRLENGNFLARVIRVEEENHDPHHDVFVIGPVNAVDLPTSFTVRNKTVDLSGNPAVFAFDSDTTGTINQIAVGDFVKAEGEVQNHDTIVATEIEIRGSLISDINAESQTLTASNTTIVTTPATQYKNGDGTPITFADLVIGDLVKISGAYSDTSTFTATEIKRRAPVNFSGQYASFLPTNHSVNGGKPTLTAPENQNTFGFIEVNNRAFGSDANVIYEVRGRISTDSTVGTQTPDMRLRTNEQTFQKSAYTVVESVGTGSVAPTPGGREYVHYYVPAQPSANPSMAQFDHWFADVDLMNFYGTNASNKSLTLQKLDVRAIPLSKVRVVETLKTAEFTDTSEGWVSGGAPGFFTIAQSTSGVNGSIDLAASDANTFGFWTGDTEVPAVAGNLYRGRFFVRAASADRNRVPTFRVRLNISDFQLASVVSIESVNGADESPDSEGRLYDCYMYIPAGVPAGKTILASLDFLNVVADNDLESSVSLDSFTLERVVIDP